MKHGINGFIPKSAKSIGQWLVPFVAYPIIRIGLAMSEMKRRGIIPDDSIFVPGHTVTLT